MKKKLLVVSLCFVTTLTYSQHSFIGIQNSPRKGMIHAAMNPAELNHLFRKVELNLFALGATGGNNILTFQDIIKEEDLLNLAFNSADGAVNVSTEVHLVGPSFGFIVKKWSFGFLSEAFVKGDIMNLNPDLGRAFSNGNFQDNFYETDINNFSNQRAHVSSYAKFGLIVGRKIWSNQSHVVTAGGSFNFFVPGSYLNMGLNNLRGRITQNQDEFSLSNTSGNLNISYPQGMEEWDIVGQMRERMSFNNISGFAMDLGITHQWKKNGIAKFSSGFAIKNLGSLNLSSGQVNNSYEMDIPEGQTLRLDLLEGNLEEIETQLLSSGYFTKSSLTDESRASLPAILSAYTDVRVSRIFQVSIYGQHSFSNQLNNNQLTVQNVFAITPRLTLGGLEIYSPWANYEVSGLTGGVGLRLGGFFVGSHSVLTGFFSDSKQADVHLGLSVGFGKRKEGSQKKKETEYPHYL